MEKINKMNGFLDWMENIVQSLHRIDNAEFDNILEKF